LYIPLLQIIVFRVDRLTFHIQSDYEKNFSNLNISPRRRKKSCTIVQIIIRFRNPAAAIPETIRTFR